MSGFLVDFEANRTEPRCSTQVAEEQATLLEQLGVPQDSESSEEPAEEEAVTV